MMQTGKSALITGAASGIGQATARLFAAEGYRLALVDINSRALEEASQEIRRTGRGVLTAVCDVGDYQQVQQAAHSILNQMGHVDVLVNNAGVSQPKKIVELEEAEWDRTLDVNLKGAFNWSKALLPSMLARKSGKIINISSVSGKHGGGQGTVSKACYAASKAGLLGFTRGLAREVAPAIQVNAICPGLIETPMTRKLISEAADELLSLIPLGRFGTPEDVARMVLFLASPGGDYLTGEVIDINGGLFID